MNQSTRTINIWRDTAMTPRCSSVISVCSSLLFLAILTSNHLFAAPAAERWFSPEGLPMTAGNPVETNGLIRKFNAPALRVTRTTSANPQGTILLLPGGGYHVLDTVGEGSLTAAELNRFGYDVVTLEYHIASGEKTRDLALQDALRSWQLIKTRSGVLGVRGGRSGIMGYSAGGHLAARTVQYIAAKSPDQQPDDLILIYPAYLDENDKGNAQPTIRPPDSPLPRLLVMIAADDKPAWVKSSASFVDSWRKSGGQAHHHVFAKGGHGFGMKPGLNGDLKRWSEILGYLLETGPVPGAGPFNTRWPGFAAHRADRRSRFAAQQPKERETIVFLGDSITEQWNLPRCFPGLKVANRGISGDTTRGMLCRLEQDVLNLQPKTIVLLGGINDLSHPPEGTPDAIAKNVRSILEQIQQTFPRTPVFVCEILPSKSKTDGSVRAANLAVDKVLSGFPNVRRVKTHDRFLDSKGIFLNSLFSDGTHLNPAGYGILTESVKSAWK